MSRRNMKVSIIGAGGLVGSSAAFALQCGGVVRSLAAWSQVPEEPPARCFTPAIPPTAGRQWLGRWQDALGRSLAWHSPQPPAGAAVHECHGKQSPSCKQPQSGEPQP